MREHPYHTEWKTMNAKDQSRTDGKNPRTSRAWLELTYDHIAALALEHGFKLKPQVDGRMALNDYVIDFARAVYDIGHAAAKSETAAAGISDAAVQALESIAAMTFDRWSEGYRAGQIAIAALDKLRVQTTEWGPAPVGNEADEPRSLADRLDLMADAQAAGSTAQSDLYAAATVCRKHLRGQPAPTQADSAPAVSRMRLPANVGVEPHSAAGKDLE